MIIPIIDYGLRSRESSLKVNASQIVGTISHFIRNPKDLSPYLDTLVNALKISVCDPIGDVRNISAKAFGALALKLSVYILKHDEYEVIKNTADNVWKENVSNTPKILKQILPTLVKKLIELSLQNDCETALKFSQLVFSTFISPHTLEIMGPLIQ